MSHTTRCGVVVIGGGIGGLTTALALARRGRRVHVLEQAEEFGEVGAGIQLAPNALRILDDLGVLDGVTRDAFLPRRLALMDAVSGELITALDTGSAFRERFGQPYIVTHRRDLLQALLTACHASDSVVLQTGRQVQAVDHTGAGARVTCTDGSVYECDALIGADGLRSTVREMVIGDGEPTVSGFVAYRGTVPTHRVREAGGLPEIVDMVVWAGPGIHLVQYPVRRGELCNQVAVFHSPSHRDGMADEEWGTVEELEAAFAPACPAVAAGIGLVDRNRRWPLFDRPPVPSWTAGRITLLGDAAHPMLQFAAQGACQAMEDAAALAECLDSHADPSDAFAEYDRRRSPRAASVQRAARTFGEIMHIDGIGASMRSALLRQRPHDDFGPFDWLYGVDLAEAPELLRGGPDRSTYPATATTGP